MSEPAIVLLSYMRPELTLSSARRLLELNTKLKIYISVDALRPNASPEEMNWQRETLRTVSQLCEEEQDICQLSWNEWAGIRDHIVRALGTVFQSHDAAILLEEDMSISQEGLDFLRGQIGRDAPVIAAAFTSSIHANSSNVCLSTAFPEQWGVGINRKFYEEVLETLRAKTIDRQVVRNVVVEQIESNRLRKSAQRFWNRHFSRNCYSLHGWDSLFQYTSWRVGVLAKVPQKSEVLDLSHLDDRAFTSRRGVRVNGSHVLSVRANGQGFYCIKCEEVSMYRVRGNTVRRIQNLMRKVLPMPYGK